MSSSEISSESESLSGSSSESSSILSSDLDEFIMSTSQSNALSRHSRRRSGKSNNKLARRQTTDGLLLEDEFGDPSSVVIYEKKKKKRPTTLSRPSSARVSPIVKDLLGQANNAFLKRQYEVAIPILEEAIRLAPGLADPFVTLGAIYEEQGDLKRSLEALLVAVHLTPADAELWERVAHISAAGGNTDQAIYCYKRCLKNANMSAQNEENRSSEGGADGLLSAAAESKFNAFPISSDQIKYVTEIASLQMQTGQFGETVGLLKKYFAHPDFAKVTTSPGGLSATTVTTASTVVELGTMLAKSLYNTNDKPGSVSVLEKIILLQVDANLVNMLAEVYLDIREFAKCYNLLSSVLDMDHLGDPEKCPVDLVVKLAVSVAPTFDRHKSLIKSAIHCLRECTPVESHLDLYVAMADGFMGNGLVDLAVELLSPLLTQNFFDPSFRAIIQRLGKCYYMQNKFELAAEMFDKLDVANDRMCNPELIVMVSDCWKRMGRDLEAGDLLMSRLTYEDLQASKTLPAAISSTERSKMLEQARNLLTTCFSGGSFSVSLTLNRFSNIFLQLLQDCELDVLRVARHKTVEGLGSTNHPGWRVKKELDLENVEDMLGVKAFVEFVVRGALVCGSLGKGKETVELIEAILLNKRKKWTQRMTNEERVENVEFYMNKNVVSYGLLDTDVGWAEGLNGLVADNNTVFQILEAVSYQVSLTSLEMYKTSIRYLRQQVVEALDGGPLVSESQNTYIETRLGFMTKILFATPDLVLCRRDLMDQRSWLVRQIRKYPYVYSLCLFCGHFCMYFQSFKFAHQEYFRAHRLRPSDPFPLLCLSSSLLSLAMSRTTKDRQLTVLKAIGAVKMYQKLRRESAPQDSDCASLSAQIETQYNVARALHQIGLLAQADRAYREILNLVEETPIDQQTSHIVSAAVYNLNLIRAKNELGDLVLGGIVAR